MSGTVGAERWGLWGMSLGPLLWTCVLCCAGLLVPGAGAAEPDSFGTLDLEFTRDVRPLLTRYCLDCHATEAAEGDLDLERFARVADVRSATPTWLKVVEMVEGREMPPKDGRRLPRAERERLLGWISRYLKAEAHARAGDPGPVVLRRLSNAQYTYTLRDLTGVPLDPAREFPVDGAAGEGFTNTGNALVMSPALLTKYLDAAKAVAAHAVFLPDGLRFSPGTTRRDWTDEILHEIKAFYARYADAEGHLPLEKYLAALLAERSSLAKGTARAADIARQRGLNPRYLESLWSVLNDSPAHPSLVVDTLRARWRKAAPGDAAALAAEVARWQGVLSRFQKVGHIKPWVVPVNPVTTRQELRLKLPESIPGTEVTVSLVAGDAGDGAKGDLVVWQQPRLVMPGRDDLALRDVRAFTHAMVEHRRRVFASAAKCLEAAAEAGANGGEIDRDDLARRYGVERPVLAAWLDYLGIGGASSIRLDLLKERVEQSAGYDFIKAWRSGELPTVVANASDQHVRIPGNMRPHGVAVHPTPTHAVAVGWLSPVAGIMRVEGRVVHAHPECGNGVVWSLERRRGSTRQRLAEGGSTGSKPVEVGPIEGLAAEPGDLISLLIGPRDGNHACDLTDVSLKLVDTADPARTWDLSADVSGDLLSSNPHADRRGHPRVWHFYKEPVQGNLGPVVPAESVLARWLAAPDREQKQARADELQRLLDQGPPAAAGHPDAVLYRQMASLSGPLCSGKGLDLERVSGQGEAGPQWGLDPARFGRAPDGAPIEATSLAIAAPAVLKVRLPADLVAGCELVATAVLRSAENESGTAQVVLTTGTPGVLTELRPDAPVLVADRAEARARIEQAFDDFRRWFPAALCYNRIVPVDEAVTLALFHREDEPLRRLMLDEREQARLDRLWEELHFVSRDAIALVDAYAQLMEYATQDSDPRLFEHLRKPIRDGAAAFRQALAAAEPRQLDAVVALAARAYRSPLTGDEEQELRTLYRKLRGEEIHHDEAIRLTLARVLVAPAFLYRIERPGPGAEPSVVSDWELASRLSYFLWSSAPDDTLRAAAASGRLHDPEVLAAEARRMLGDEKVRRLATEFACQWLHVYDFDSFDEKSERHFPTFARLRGALYEEAIRFFTDLFQRDGSILEVFDADHTFVNEELAAHYGIAGVRGPEWRRVDGVRAIGRGGILGLGATLARQSGASRTSPILRGNWVSEVLLGEKLPKPPPGVPPLPEDEAASDLTVRQLVERHTRDVRCAGCHVRIDPLGYALEAYDPIGRFRTQDLGGRPIDTHAKLRDGTEFAGGDGLRRYLLTTRRDTVVRQFCRKLLGYALGRGIQLSDEPLLDEMQQKLKSGGYRFSIAVEAIVRSRQFREIRGRDAVVAESH